MNNFLKRLPMFWKFIVSLVGNTAATVYLYFNDHGGVPNHFSSSDKWVVLFMFLTSLGVFGKSNEPYRVRGSYPER